MRWLGLLLAVLGAGCATAFPDEVMRTVNTRITADELRALPEAHKGARVIVGGEILATQPRQDETEIELLTRRLRGDDSPERSDRSPGRVLLRARDFLDPAVYAPGRRITVIGEVTGVEERRIGDVAYRYPVVAVERIRLWPKDVVVAPYYGTYPWPYYWPYGPYYDPFWPRRYYPGWWW
ncbi:MAG TPA: Slp/YeaY family lipoprotein [Candidatus Deferrimicrobiaceae bacterium]|nr:Slp/YeaY family lipoprotein [Candidatus Deferrimicrobiaceae bacterium]